MIGRRAFMHGAAAVGMTRLLGGPSADAESPPTAPNRPWRRLTDAELGSPAPQCSQTGPFGRVKRR